jgi:predicted DNA-binding WGR domain protein
MNYKHIGWCKDEKTNADKIWGVIELIQPTSSYRDDGKFVTFWGRRGKKLQTKLVDGSNWDVHKLFLKKLDKGYQEVDVDGLNKVYPEFQEDLEKTAMWAMLSA